MESARTSVLARDDTFFGVCHALGEDFGFNPIFLRLAFALLLFFSPLAAIAGYAALGVVVAATRWLVPNPRVADTADDANAGETAAQMQAAAEDQMELALAA